MQIALVLARVQYLLLARVQNLEESGSSKEMKEWTEMTEDRNMSETFPSKSQSNLDEETGRLTSLNNQIRADLGKEKREDVSLQTCF